jgi:hypothetical protein
MALSSPPLGPKPKPKPSLSSPDTPPPGLAELRGLEGTYSSLLDQHERAHAIYVDALLEQKLGKRSGYTEIPGKTYWGTRPVDSLQNVASVGACRVACAKNNDCTGATFNSAQNHCWLRGGYSHDEPGTADDTAIMSEVVKAGRQLEELDLKIRHTRKQMDALRSSETAAYNEYAHDVAQQGRRVQDYGALVKKERETIARLEAQHGTLEKMNSDNSTYATQQHWSFTMWFVLAAVLSLVLWKVAASIPAEGQRGVSTFSWAVVIFGLVLLGLIYRRTRNKKQTAQDKK